jgi:hypothetical protein
MPTDYTPAFLVACAELHHLDFIANSFVKSAQLLLNNRDGSEHSQSFHLLVSMAFELLPKVIIGCNVCLLYQNDTKITVEEIRAKIVDEHRKMGHNLKKLFEKFPDLMNELDIEAVTKIPDDPTKEWFVSEYRFKLKGEDYLLSIKDVEAVRYGTFAQQRDVALDGTGDEKIMTLLLNLQTFVRNKKLKTINEMKKVYAKN